MRFIPTKTHGYMDYLGGILLIAVPLIWIQDGGPAVWIPMIAGLVVLVQSLLTDYELGMTNLVPMPVHLTMDGVVGAVMALSPWLFGFYEMVWIPHLLMGIALIGGAMTTHLHRQEPAMHGIGRTPTV